MTVSGTILWTAWEVVKGRVERVAAIREMEVVREVVLGRTDRVRNDMVMAVCVFVYICVCLFDSV